MAAKPDPEKVLAEALSLDASTRALIADVLLESLDADDDFAVSQEWLEEIRRRAVMHLRKRPRQFSSE